mmetsp:Transcript_41817/g.63918  ORF Transcript_41817/g.63918 Transcript_41817/m.63918 type:complete len:189 (-) Transcript_41817:642-1208(-)
MEFQREIESLKNKCREMQSETERMEFKTNSLVEQNQKLQLKTEKKVSETHQALSEKVQLENVVKSKDQMIDTLNKQINQLREDLKSKDLEQETALRRRHEEDRQRELQAKNEIIKLQHDIELAKKQRLENEHGLRSETQKWRGDAEIAERKLSQVTEEFKAAQQKLKEVQGDLEILQRNQVAKEGHMT